MKKKHFFLVKTTVNPYQKKMLIEKEPTKQISFESKTIFTLKGTAAVMDSVRKPREHIASRKGRETPYFVTYI